MLNFDLPDMAEHERQQLELILLTWRCWARQPPALIRELGDGLTNNSYLLADQDRRYVLRVNSPRSHALDLHRTVETRVLRLAANAGIAPTLIYSDPHERFLVTGYVAGTKWPVQQSRSDQGIKQLAQLLKRIHNLEAQPVLLDIEQKARYYWRHLDPRSELTGQLESVRGDIQHHLYMAVVSNTAPCLCHNDLLPENIIVDAHSGKLCAIDWEYTAMGDAYFDLAAIVEGHGLDSRQSVLLLEEYHAAAISSTELERLYYARVLYCYLVLLWHGVRFSPPQLQAMSAPLNTQLMHLKQLLCNDN